MTYDSYSNSHDTIGDAVIVELLTKEKIKLARDLGQIDRRLQEIHDELEKYNGPTVQPVQVVSRPPKKSPTFANIMSCETLDKLEYKDTMPWYDIKFPDLKLQHHQLLVQKNCILWPLSYSFTSDEVIIHECTTSNQHMSFVFDTTKLYKLSLTEDIWSEDKDRYDSTNRYVDMIFIERQMKGFVGFFVNPVDIDKIRIQ